MQIAILGMGNVGAALGRHLIQAGAWSGGPILKPE